jgi:SAM-dependent methyltransferase
MFDVIRWAEVPWVAVAVTRLAGLILFGDPGDRPAGAPSVLDLCCGMGRISLELARMGFAVTGVDITKSYLQAAVEDASGENLAVEFIREDVRSFNRPLAFDTAINLYNSFGYFENPDDDRLFARNAFESLKPGGAFIVELLGKEIAVRDFVEAEWFEHSGYTVLTETAPLDGWAAVKNRWILIRDGERVERSFTQRLYAASELRRLLLDSGFSTTEVYGSWDDGPYDQNASTLIVVGRKQNDYQRK